MLLNTALSAGRTHAIFCDCTDIIAQSSFDSGSGLTCMPFQLVTTALSSQALPSELGALQKLQTLSASGNDIAAVPPELLHGCLALQTLSLHDCPITFAVSPLSAQTMLFLHPFLIF